LLEIPLSQDPFDLGDVTQDISCTQDDVEIMESPPSRITRLNTDIHPLSPGPYFFLPLTEDNQPQWLTLKGTVVCGLALSRSATFPEAYVSDSWKWSFVRATTSMRRTHHRSWFRSFSLNLMTILEITTSYARHGPLSTHCSNYDPSPVLRPLPCLTSFSVYRHLSVENTH
jgi:hypothetical protein